MEPNDWYVETLEDNADGWIEVRMENEGESVWISILHSTIPELIETLQKLQA